MMVDTASNPLNAIDQYLYDLKSVVFHVGEDSHSGHCKTCYIISDVLMI